MQMQDRAERKMRAEVGILSLRGDVHVVLVVDASGVHEASRLPHVFVQFLVIVVHGGLGLFQMRSEISVQILAEPGDALATEDAENIALLGSKLGRGFSAKRGEVIAQECRYAGQAQMGQTGAVINQRANALAEFGQHDKSRFQEEKEPGKNTHHHVQVDAVAQMDSLQIAHHRVAGPRRMSERQNTFIGDRLAFDKADTTEFGQSGQLLDTDIG